VKFDFAKIEEEKTNFYLILVCERRDFKQNKKIPLGGCKQLEQPFINTVNSVIEKRI